MAGGKFVPSFHDSFRHAPETWSKLPGCAADRKDDAIAKAHAAIDKLILGEIAHTIGQMHDKGVNVEI
jgi:hypothetical protein